MTIGNEKMTAEQYLSQAIDIDLRINALSKQLEQSRMRLNDGNLGNCVSNVPPQHNGEVSNPVQDNVENVLGIEEQVRDYKKMYTELKSEIINKIMAIDIHIYSTLLFARYINGMSWEDVSHDVRKSLDYTKKELHRAALNYFAIKYNFST